MKEKRTDRKIDKNFFREMNYEIAAEHNAIDNEDMKKNKNVSNSKNKNKRDKK